jgi:hypothetical protein
MPELCKAVRISIDSLAADLTGNRTLFHAKPARKIAKNYLSAGLSSIPRLLREASVIHQPSTQGRRDRGGACMSRAALPRFAPRIPEQGNRHAQPVGLPIFVEGKIGDLPNFFPDGSDTGAPMISTASSLASRSIFPGSWPCA